jgi:hypothetical protein
MWAYASFVPGTIPDPTQYLASKYQPITLKLSVMMTLASSARQSESQIPPSSKTSATRFDRQPRSCNWQNYQFKSDAQMPGSKTLPRPQSEIWRTGTPVCRLRRRS